MANPSSGGAAERREAYYTGRVQGVGFRYTVRHIASVRPVAGFVKNLSDGRVQLVVEGAGADLDELFDTIAERMAPNIADVAIDVRPAVNEFAAFEIRY